MDTSTKQALRSELLSLSRDRLGDYTVSQLRNFRAAAGLPSKINQQKKALIIEALSAWIDENTATTAHSENDDSIDESGRDERIEEIAQQGYLALLDYIIEGDPFAVEVVAAAASAIHSALIAAATENGYGASSTILDYRAAVMKAIERKLMAETYSPKHPKLAPGEVFGLFRRIIDPLFAGYRAEKAAASLAAMESRKLDRIEIKPDRLIQWAVSTVRNLPSKASAWPEVAIAIAALTGRRAAEILGSGEFGIPIDRPNLDPNNWVSFSGQLKRHADEIVDAFDIPVLGGAAAAIPEAIAWLEKHDRRVSSSDIDQWIASKGLDLDDEITRQQAAAKIAHNRYSKALSASTKWILDRHCDLEVGATWEFNGGKSDRRKFHLLRQIYAQIQWKICEANRRGRGIDPHTFIANIMGHSAASSARNSAKAYDADIFVITNITS
jgi:hypothetical protein